ncbi:MAG: glycosyltransferase, partial [Gaiellaceae bacterium]
MTNQGLPQGRFLVSHVGKMKIPVSVIINVFNEAGSIEREIREIHAEIIQKLPGSELIVAEDGST